MSPPDAGDLARLAVGALLFELNLYPKPGLVSQVDSGAHRDMDHRLLDVSARCLEPFFRELAEAGRSGGGFFDRLVPIGRRGEEEMLAATGGVNTHRGALFSLGLLVAAAAATSSATADSLRRTLLACWIQVFFVLLEVGGDTNVLHRGGTEGAAFLRSTASNFLAAGGCRAQGWMERAVGLHHECIRRNLSPGGTADLLAAARFVADWEGAYGRAATR